MLIKLLPDQIVPVWDVIKYAAKKSIMVDREDERKYYLSLLVRLLNSQTQCIMDIDVDNDRNIIFVATVSSRMDRFSGETTLAIECVYSFTHASDEVWKYRFDYFSKLARAMKCQNLSIGTGNDTMANIVINNGFVRLETEYSKKIGE